MRTWLATRYRLPAPSAMSALRFRSDASSSSLAAVGNRSFSVVVGASATEAVVGAVEQRELPINFAGRRSAWPLSSDAISSSKAHRRWMDCRMKAVRRVFPPRFDPSPC